MLLTAERVAELAADVENFHVERKRSMSDKAKIEEAICAFANDLPGSGETGVLLVGVGDDGAPSNLPITDPLLLSLSSIRSDGNILPFPQLTVYKAQLHGIDIAVVEVLPSRNTPLRLRGRVRVRVGPRRDTATRDEERILTERRRTFDGPYDQAPVTGATLDDLDLQFFGSDYLPAAVDPDTLAENRRSTAEQLAALHLASPDAVPNVAGVVMLGIEPTTWVQGAYIQFLRIDGSELTDAVIDRRQLVGPLPRVLVQADELARAHIRVATTVAGAEREQNRPDYPMDALQQLLRNAAMHRNYETSHAPSSGIGSAIGSRSTTLAASSGARRPSSSASLVATTTGTPPLPLRWRRWASSSGSAWASPLHGRPAETMATPNPSSPSASLASR